MSGGALPYQLSVDIGGTFTDLVLRDMTSRATEVGKVLTTPSEPAEGVLRGVTELLDRTGIAAGALDCVLHATTLATNALIERRGTKTALLTTAGFRDVLEIRDESRYDLFDLFLELPKPLVPRELRLEVDERILSDGSVQRPLDADRARAVVRSLPSDVGAVAICLLHSYRNADHERALQEIVAAERPDVEIAVSHEVAPEIREFPRTATTVANVYVQRLMSRYLQKLKGSLAELGVASDLFVMLSSGSLCDIDTASRFPVRLVESGPAAGVIAAAAYSTAASRESIISFDMGGTTAKACLVEDGQPQRSDQFEVDRVWRFKAGSGTPIRTPVIDLIEIGAGGGSIAWIDDLGRLRVGPESASADPGPACYGLGGNRPTVTDADLVLGYLDASSFLGGQMALDPQRAATAIQEEIAEPLGLSVVEAAWGIHDVVNEAMAAAARMAATERGNDPRDYPIFAFGGGGPVHAFGVARVLGSPALMMPLRAGVMSAVGLQCAPLAFDFVQSWLSPLEELDQGEIGRLLADMAAQGEEILTRTGLGASEVTITLSADMRYTGQGFEINVPVSSNGTGPSRAELEESFTRVYQRRHGLALEAVPVEVVNWRCIVSGPLPATGTPSSFLDSREAGGPVPSGRRPIYSPGRGGMVDAPVYDRYALRPGDAAQGPAIVEEHESTLVVAGEAEIAIDEVGNVIVELVEGKAP